MKLFDDLIHAFFSLRMATHYGIPLADSQATLSYLAALSNWYLQRWAAHYNA